MNHPHIELCIFDLDGTLYEDTHHFDYYAKKLLEYVKDEWKNSFWNDYKAGCEDAHTLRIGRIYDSQNQLVLVQKRLIVEEAYYWNGQELPDEEVQRLYPEPIVIDMQRFLSVGDLWWVPGAIARHYGVAPDQSQKAFLATREYMMKEEFTMTQRDDLIELLQKLHQDGCKLALMTNSPEIDSERILEKLGIDSFFDYKQFLSQKPTRTRERIETIAAHFQVQYPHILSVGDNWLNEIAPAAALGCQTLFIDPHDIGEELESNYRVRSLTEMIDILQTL